METIISIIVAIGILIFKAVAKNMEKSADKPVRPVRPVGSAVPLEPERPAAMQEVFPQILEELFDVHVEHEEPEVEMKVEEQIETKVQESVQPQIVRKPAPAVTQKQIPVDSENGEKKEKIDPKKLIIYSEIMNRKY